jgi:hypothetical protein
MDIKTEKCAREKNEEGRKLELHRGSKQGKNKKNRESKDETQKGEINRSNVIKK